MGCNVLRGPRPAAWDQEAPSTEEGLPDADWSTKLYTQQTMHTLHLPSDQANTIPVTPMKYVQLPNITLFYSIQFYPPNPY